jgi:hypothetical protein
MTDEKAKSGNGPLFVDTLLLVTGYYPLAVTRPASLCWVIGTKAVIRRDGCVAAPSEVEPVLLFVLSTTAL